MRSLCDPYEILVYLALHRAQVAELGPRAHQHVLAVGGHRLQRVDCVHDRPAAALIVQRGGRRPGLEAVSALVVPQPHLWRDLRKG